MSIKHIEEIVTERAKRLQDLRKFFGISRAKLASSLEISEATLQNYEKGITKVPLVYILYLELLTQRSIDADRIYAKIANAQHNLGVNRPAGRAVIDKKPWELQVIADSRLAKRESDSPLDGTEPETE